MNYRAYIQTYIEAYMARARLGRELMYISLFLINVCNAR